MNKLLAALLATVVMAPAMATVSGDNSCQGNCPTTTTGTPSSSTSTSTSSATGGAGGTGVGIGVGGSSKSSSNSNVSNSGNSSSRSGVSNSGNSSSRSNVSNSGNSSNRNSNRNSNSQSQLQGQAQRQTQSSASNSSNGDNTGTNTSNITYAAPQRAAATAYAAPLTSSNDTCMGSTSAGVQAPGFGITGGTTWTDKNCVMLKNSRELWNMGMKEAALARMCMDPDNKEAMELTGVTCPVRKQATGPDAVQASSKDTGSWDRNDQFIRIRMGLPPLESK